MPDEWGKPTINDGLNLMQGLMSIQHMQTEKAQEARQTAQYNQEQKSLSLASEIVKNPGLRIDPAQYTPQEALLARSKAAELSINESNATVAGKQALAAKYEQKFLESMPKLQAIQAKKSAGDVQGYKQAATDYYNSLVGDGHYATLTQEGGWELEGPDGTKSTVPFPDDEMVNEFIAFNSQPMNFIALSYGHDQERNRRNVANLAKGQELLVGGKSTGVFFTQLEKNNRIEPFFYNPYNNQPVDPKAVKALVEAGAVPREQYDKYLETYKKVNEATRSAQDVVIGGQRIGLNAQEAGLKSQQAQENAWDIYNKSQENPGDKAFTDIASDLEKSTQKTYIAGTGDNKQPRTDFVPLDDTTFRNKRRAALNKGYDIKVQLVQYSDGRQEVNGYTVVQATKKMTGDKMPPIQQEVVASIKPKKQKEGGTGLAGAKGSTPKGAAPKGKSILVYDPISKSFKAK